MSNYFSHLYYPGHQYYCIKCSECIKYDKLNNVDCTLPRYIPIIPETEPEMPVKIKKGKKVPKKGKSYQTKITSSNNDSVKAVTKKRKAHSLDHGDVTNLVDHNLPPANDSNESLHKVETKFDSLIKSDDKLEKTVDRTENSTSSSGAHLLN